MLSDYDMVQREAKRLGGGTIAIAGAHSQAVLEAVKIAKDDGIMIPILVGDAEKIKQLAASISLDLRDTSVHEEREEETAAEKAVQLVHDGEAEGLMKGKVSTPVLLKAVLNKKYNLRTDRLLSHVALLEIPKYHKLLLFTDGGMVIQPTLEEKIAILKNAVEVMRALGVKRPKVAVLAAIETVNSGMPETLDAKAIVELARKGEFGNVEVEGPMAMDIALSPESARLKGVESNISGDPDILLMPNISAGNISAKGLWHLAGAQIAGLIVGARKPIILLSRADNAMTKLNSVALAVVTSRTAIPRNQPSHENETKRR